MSALNEIDKIVLSAVETLEDSKCKNVVYNFEAELPHQADLSCSIYGKALRKLHNQGFIKIKKVSYTIHIETIPR